MSPAQMLKPGLAARGVVLSTGVIPSLEELRLLEPVFDAQIFPVLTTVALADDGIFPLLTPLANYLAVQLAPADGTTAPRRARMQAPTRPGRHAVTRHRPHAV